MKKQMQWPGLKGWGLLLTAAVLLLAVGCSTVSKLGTQVAASKGVISRDQARSINKTVDAFDASFENLTPEQEYYIGRAVAATVLKTYQPYRDDDATDYLNRLGQTLALACDRPETFAGYHFLLLDSDEINAFSAPGGFIMISRGMMRCCQTEDALAAVLAHEIGHVENQHGLRAIKKSRLNSAFTVLAMEGAKQFGGEDLAELTQAFKLAIGDIALTLMESGYARDLEKEADASAVKIMKRVGYDSTALIAMLSEMDKRLKPNALDFAKTHPDPEDRIKEVQSEVDDSPAVSRSAARQKRFAKATGSI